MATKPLRGIHVFWWLAAFFVVTFAVNGYFIVRAVNTFPGEQVKNSYVLGLDFNRQVARRAAQAELGWTAEAGLVGGLDATLLVRLASSSGAVSGLSVEVKAVLPGRGVMMLNLIERAPGEYVVRFPTDGARRVDIEITATRAGESVQVFEAFKSLEIAL